MIDKMRILGKTIYFLKQGILLIPIALISLVSNFADSREGVDRSRAGEVLLRHEVEMMEEFVYPYATVDVRWLPVVNISAIGRTFHVRPAAIRQFRWGYSLAPSGHILAQTVWYTIWHRSEDRPERICRTTLRIDADDDRIIEEREW